MPGRLCFVALAIAVALLGCPTGSDDDTQPDDDAGDDDDSARADADEDGWSILRGDCDDDDPTIYPYADEVPYDGIDQDCDGADLTDVDRDGYDAEEAGGSDCDDADPDVFPGAEEEPYDGIDDDCDGADLTDVDGDGYDAVEVGGTDCDDEAAEVYPGAEPVCDGHPDQDCEGGWDDDEVDDDNDGWSECTGDCDDTDYDISPDALDLCDGMDTNCDGHLIFGEADLDGDGWMFCAGDCDDLDASLTPDDLDGDTYSTCQGDCDDADASVNPSVAEVADGIDNDCDGTVDTDVVTCTLTVPTDHATLQAAIDAAQAGDVICAQPGTYPENLDLSGKAVTLLGLGGRAATVIDGSTAGPVVTLATAEGPDTVLHGFTITNGLATNGGGVFVEGAAPTFESLRLLDNEATDNGGGIYLFDSNASFFDVLFEGNDAGVDGGGVYSEASPGVGLTGVDFHDNTTGRSGAGMGVWSSVITLEDATFVGNLAIGGPGGGYVQSDESDLDLVDAVFIGNETTGTTGGGLATEGGVVHLEDVFVMGNTAYWEGGGIGLYWANGSALDRVVVSNNTADGVAGCCGGPGLTMYGVTGATFDHIVLSDNYKGFGGGFCAWQSEELYVTNFIVAYNDIVSGTYGGMGGGIYTMTSGATFTNGLVVGNSAAGGGLGFGGGACFDSSGLDVNNTLFLGNSARASGGILVDSSSLSAHNIAVVGNTASDAMSVAGSITCGQGQLVLYNSVVVENAEGNGGSGIWAGSCMASLLHCDVYGNSPVDYEGFNTDPTGMYGNISVDPQFLDTTSSDPFAWDLHLDPASPLVDAGEISILDPDGSPSDIGAFGGPDAAFFDLDWDGYTLWWQPGPYDAFLYPDEGWDCDDLNGGVYPGSGC